MYVTKYGIDESRKLRYYERTIHIILLLNNIEILLVTNALANFSYFVFIFITVCKFVFTLTQSGIFTFPSRHVACLESRGECNDETEPCAWDSLL